MSVETKQYLNSQELAELLGVSLRTIVNLRRRRQIPYLRMGRLVRYKREAVEAALKLYTVEGVVSRFQDHQR